jgi:hypothetical protein
MGRGVKRLDINHVDLEVTFEWDTDDYDGKNYFEYIVKVEHNGEDIMELLSEFTLEEIEKNIKRGEDE